MPTATAATPAAAAGLDDVAVRMPDVVWNGSAEHHVELGEPEHERVALIDQNDLDAVPELIRQSARELQPAKPGP